MVQEDKFDSVSLQRRLLRQISFSGEGKYDRGLI